MRSFFNLFLLVFFVSLVAAGCGGEDHFSGMDAAEIARKTEEILLEREFFELEATLLVGRDAQRAFEFWRASKSKTDFEATRDIFDVETFKLVRVGEEFFEWEFGGEWSSIAKDDYVLRKSSVPGYVFSFDDADWSFAENSPHEESELIHIECSFEGFSAEAVPFELLVEDCERTVINLLVNRQTGMPIGQTIMLENAVVPEYEDRINRIWTIETIENNDPPAIVKPI